jgi:Methyltransferase domain
VSRPLFAGLSDAEWFDTNLRSPRLGENGAAAAPGLPLLPGDAEQVRFTSLAGEANLRQAFSFYGFCRQLLLESGAVESDDRILDFGSGWGRVARFWLRDVAPESLWCVDVLSDAIDLLKATRMPANVVQCDVLPPVADLPTGFRLVHAYSVFSHLSESTAHSWIQYFAGLVEPGGLIVVTTRGRPFVDWLRSSRERPTPPEDRYERHLGETAPPQDELERRYEAGEFVFLPVGGIGDELAGGYYGEAMIPPAYAKRFEQYGLTLRDVRDDVPDVEQAVIVLERP